MNKFKKSFLVFVILCIALMTTVNASAAVKLNKTKASITVGQKLKLKITGTNKTAKWSSSNKKIATVTQKGVVKGIRKGTVTITVKTANGKKATVKVTVK